MQGPALEIRPVVKAVPKDLAAALDKLEPEVARIFMTVVRDIRDELTISELVKLIGAGNLSEAMRRATQFERVADAVVAADAVGAEVTAAQARARGLGRGITFDRTRQGYANRIAMHRLRFIQDISRQQRETILQVLVDGTRDGINPRQIARGIRDSIGLTPRMQTATSNFRRALMSRNESMLNAILRGERYTLMDGRQKVAIRRALREGKPIPLGQVNRMVARYRQRAINLRAETIARTEVLRAIHEGQEEMLLQMIQSGRVDPASVGRVWHTRLDGRQRDSHDSLSGQKRAYGEAFVSGEGYHIAYPGDPDAPGSETINCRCSLSFSADPPKKAVLRSV